MDTVKKKPLAYYRTKLSIFKQGQVASAIGVHQSFLSRLLKGKHTFTNDMRLKLDNFLAAH